jgi:hypothetical protein
MEKKSTINKIKFGESTPRQYFRVDIFNEDGTIDESKVKKDEDGRYIITKETLDKYGKYEKI